MVFVVIADLIPLEKRGTYQGWARKRRNTCMYRIWTHAMLICKPYERGLCTRWSVRSLAGCMCSNLCKNNVILTGLSTLQGAFTDNVTWRWNLFIKWVEGNKKVSGYLFPTHSLPLAELALVIMIFFLHLPTEPQNIKEKFKRIDYLGGFGEAMIYELGDHPSCNTFGK